MFYRRALLMISLVCLWAMFETKTFQDVGIIYADDNQEVYTHQLSQSTANTQIWTAPPSTRIFKDDAIPTEVASSVKVYAAKNEFEPFQLIVKPTSSKNINVTVGDFGHGITTEIYQVKYVNISQATDSLGKTGDYPDPLWPLENGAAVSVIANENTAFWFSISVPKSAPAGDHTTQVHIDGISIPIVLHVFDFAIPDTLHVKSQMNVSHQNFLNYYGVSGTGSDYWFYVDKIKQFFIDHRLTPKSALWSGGLTGQGAGPYIDYDCNGTLSDPYGIWGFETPADKYLNGNGFNDGTGFPSFMAATFQNNDSSDDQRPSEFCNLTRSANDWYTANNPNTAYNQAWFTYMGVIETYLNQLGYLDQGYYYFANEPQDQADYDAVAWYSQELKKAAPNFKLMVSEEPKPEIHSHPTYPGAKIDIWLPVLHQYDPVAAQDRQQNHDEDVWIYFLHGTRPPFFNPITLDHPGIESKLTGWFLWKYRLRGLAYYSLNNWGKNPWTDPMTSNHNGDTFMLYPPAENNQPIAYGSNNHRFVPSIRFELMRDSLEDYEYLYVLHGGQPEVGISNSADTQANKIIAGLTSYTRDDDFMYNLRRLIGLKNGNAITTIPDIQPPASHPRTEGPPSDYYLNFQDPNGQPTTNPLIVDGKTYMKIGWNEYEADTSLGYGWYGDMAQVEYQYLSNAPNPLQQSIIFDDWGRQKTFEFDLPNGEYNVTVSVGWQGKTYSRNFIEIEGITFVDDEPSSPYLVRSNAVTIQDNKLTMAMGIFDEYTMLNYLDIEAIPTTITDAAITDVVEATNRVTLTLQWTPLAQAVTTTIKYADTPITEENWASATVLTDSLSSSTTSFAAQIPNDGKTYYLALRSIDTQSTWSTVSNLVFWPQKRVYLPLILR